MKFNCLGITEFSINVDGMITLLMSIGAAGFLHTSMITLDSTVIDALVPTSFQTVEIIGAKLYKNRIRTQWSSFTFFYKTVVVYIHRGNAVMKGDSSKEL